MTVMGPTKSLDFASGKSPSEPEVSETLGFVDAKDNQNGGTASAVK